MPKNGSKQPTSVAEDIRKNTVQLLKKEARHTGKAKMDWVEYEEIMKQSMNFPINRGFLLGLLLVKKFGQIRVTLELLPKTTPKKERSQRK